MPQRAFPNEIVYFELRPRVEWRLRPRRSAVPSPAAAAPSPLTATGLPEPSPPRLPRSRSHSPSPPPLVSATPAASEAVLPAVPEIDLAMPSTPPRQPVPEGSAEAAVPDAAATPDVPVPMMVVRGEAAALASRDEDRDDIDTSVRTLYGRRVDAVRAGEAMVTAACLQGGGWAGR